MKFEIKKSRIGRGVFATRDIEKNEHIFTFSGNVLRDKEYARKLSCALQTGTNVWLNPKEGPSRYINHSCSPNSGIKGTKKIIAMKKIKKGEEITIDYSITDNDPLWEMKCNCQSKNCRKTIKTIRFLPSNTYKKYKLFIPKFLQKSYEKETNSIFKV